jgi:hypothetical protein
VSIRRAQSWGGGLPLPQLGRAVLAPRGAPCLQRSVHWLCSRYLFPAPDPVHVAPARELILFISRKGEKQGVQDMGLGTP